VEGERAYRHTSKIMHVHAAQKQNSEGIGLILEVRQAIESLLISDMHRHVVAEVSRGIESGCVATFTRKAQHPKRRDVDSASPTGFHVILQEPKGISCEAF